MTPKGDDVNLNVVSWVTAFECVTEALFSAMGMTASTSVITTEDVTGAIMEAFPSATVVTQPAIQYAPTVAYAPATGGTVRVKGTQHGPLPTWLAGECAKKGVTEVWDNRDGLQVNPKRPWFKAVTGDAAFWAPRGK